MKNLKFQSAALAAIILASFSLTGCGQDTLDWRNVQFSGGKIYATNSNKPYTGALTNVPFEQVDHLMGSYASQQIRAHVGHLLGYHTVCDTYAKEGYIDGKSICRDEKTDITQAQLSFDQGTPNGDLVLYTHDGNRKIVTAHYDESKLDGTVEIHDDTGSQLLEQMHWKEGKLDGPIKQWDEKGTMLVDANYSDGRLDGRVRTWNKKGTLITDAEYVHGVPNGKFFSRDPFNQKSSQQGTMNNNVFTGTATLYTPPVLGNTGKITVVKYVKGIVQPNPQVTIIPANSGNN